MRIMILNLLLLLGGAVFAANGSTVDTMEAVDTDYAYLNPDGAYAAGVSSPRVGYVYGNDSLVQTGIRFTAINIAQGRTIDSAWVSFRATLSAGTPCSVLVCGHDIDDAAGFGAADSISDRTRTAASVEWAPEVWTAGTRYRTADLKNIIQEIIDRAGWAANNDIALLFFNAWAHTENNHYRQFDNHVNNNYASNPILYIWWSDPTAGSVAGGSYLQGPGDAGQIHSARGGTRLGRP